MPWPEWLTPEALMRLWAWYCRDVVRANLPAPWDDITVWATVALVPVALTIKYAVDPLCGALAKLFKGGS